MINPGRDSHWRSLIKAVTWRAMGTIVTFCVAWVATGEVVFAAKIGLADTLLKIGVFYAYERVWDRISYGRSRPPEYDI